MASADDPPRAPVRRRSVLALTATALGSVAGCAVPATETPTGTPGELVVIVANEQVRGQDATVELRNNTGEVVERREITVAGGQRRELDLGGLYDVRYAVEVVVAGHRAQYTWEPTDCPELVWTVTLTREETVTSSHDCP